ncbi:MAG: MoaD/ThiS family protein [Chloroflexi bacterium]|nr:MoaD/ThiS family protein [Chloroflexota bacterium]
MAVVFIPTILRKFAGGRTTVQVEAATVGEVIDKLEQEYPGIRERLVNPDEEDRLRPGLATFVDGETSTEGLRRKLAPDAEVHFLPAIGGGAA